jgi:Exostosin family
MLSIFSDPAYLPAGASHHILFFPFWGKHPEDPRDPNTGRFDDYAERGATVLRLTRLEDADIAVVPADWSSYPGDKRARGRVRELVARATHAGKEPVVFFANDSTEPVPLPGATVLRTSVLRSARRPSEFAHPAWSEDFVERYLGGVLPVRERGERPVVGFCGLVASSRLRLPVRLALRRQERLRRDALDALERAPGVETNFVRRDHFLGGARRGGALDLELLVSARREYVQNMVESDYVVCVRGAGNFSYRLYETLSCGRIPVFVDTDCVLPFDFAVDWRDHCVWVDESEIDSIAEIVAGFHERLGDAEFAELQRRCRRLWEDYLSPFGFFANLHRHFGQPRAANPQARPARRLAG